MMSNTKYKKLKIENKDYYNRFFELHGLPNSDYCFSVIQTWLALFEEVEYVELNKKLLLLKYNDVLDNDRPTTNFTLIGDVNAIERAHIDKLCRLAEDNENKIVVTESHAAVFYEKLPKEMILIEEIGLNDYLYSVSDYASLSKPDYRRIRREISIFKRTFPKSSIGIKKITVKSAQQRNMLINCHHTWDDTFKFGNDPLRLEGIVLARALQYAKDLNLHIVALFVDEEIEGFFIYTEVMMRGVKYADVHHARFSYRYKYMNDYSFHLLAKYLDDQKYDFINFERDADILGLRKHKLLLKPNKMIHGYSLSRA